MASATSNANLYERFAPQERLTLWLEAMARGDEAEADRLLCSCPRKTYSGPDAAFDDRFHLAFDTTAIVCGDLRALVSQIRVLHWAMANVRHFSTMHHINTQMALLEGVRCAHGQTQSPYFAEKEADQPNTNTNPAHGKDIESTALGENVSLRMEAVEQRAERSTELILGVLEQTARSLAVELAGVWAAYGAFCRQKLRAEPGRVLEACRYPGVEELMHTLKMYAQHKPVEAIVAECKDAICGVWERRFEATA